MTCQHRPCTLVQPPSSPQLVPSMSQYRPALVSHWEHVSGSSLKELMGNRNEFPDKIFSWEDYNQEDPAAAGPIQDLLLTLDPAAGHTDHTQKIL